jgi:hypothetical protein
MLVYNNLPKKTTNDSANSTRSGLANFYNSELPMNDADFVAMIGFFESRGFSKESSETIAYIMFLQATIDGYNPFDVLSTVKNLNGTELTALVTEILNFNRFKTSFLGLSTTYSTQSDAQKEILP